MTRGRWCSAALLLAMLDGGPAHAAPAESARVVVIGKDGVLARRIRAEAENAGLAVMAEAPGAPAPEALERHQGVAVLVIESPHRVRFLVRDGDAPRQIVSGAEDADSFAVRVVEELRAYLVELHLVPEEAPAAAPEGVDHPSRAEPARGTAPSPTPETGTAPVDAERDVRPAGRRGAGEPAERDVAKLWVTGGLAGSAAQGGMGGTAHGAFGLRLEPTRRWRIAGEAWLPVTENTWRRDEGNGQADVTLILARVGHAPLLLGERGSIEAGVGGGLLVLSMAGEAAAPWLARTDRAFSGVYFAHAGAAWTVTSWLQLRGTLLAGASAPRLVATFDGAEAAAWGRWFGGAVLSAELGLALSGSGAGS